MKEAEKEVLVCVCVCVKVSVPSSEIWLKGMQLNDLDESTK